MRKIDEWRMADWPTLKPQIDEQGTAEIRSTDKQATMLRSYGQASSNTPNLGILRFLVRQSAVACSSLLGSSFLGSSFLGSQFTRHRPGRNRFYRSVLAGSPRRFFAVRWEDLRRILSPTTAVMQERSRSVGFKIDRRKFMGSAVAAGSLHDRPATRPWGTRIRGSRRQDHAGSHRNGHPGIQ